jgi:hypothetical protein
MEGMEVKPVGLGQERDARSEKKMTNPSWLILRCFQYLDSAVFTTVTCMVSLSTGFWIPYWIFFYHFNTQVLIKAPSLISTLYRSR